MATKIIERKEETQVVSPETGKTDFWTGKVPCYEMCHCPKMIKEECPAQKYTEIPCWAIEGTYCKLDDYGATGTDTSICEVCRVYKKYGEGKPIQVKLFGKGMNTAIKAAEPAS